MRGYFLTVGGGAGDVFWTALNDIRFQWLAALKEEFGYHIRVHSICHCPGTPNLFAHHPHIDEVVEEAWRLPNPEDSRRLSSPIDGLAPLNEQTLATHAVHKARLRHVPFTFRYTREEMAWAEELLSRRPCITLQPYAGLSDRDGFDPERLGQLCERLVTLDPDCQVLVLGRNHERGHKYAREECFFDHPRVKNLIDRLELRMSILLVSRCDAFAGAHSNLIRAAWHWRRRNACVLPVPMMSAEVLSTLDRQYLYGFNYPETRSFSYDFAPGGERHFETLRIDDIAQHLLGR